MKKAGLRRPSSIPGQVGLIRLISPPAPRDGIVREARILLSVYALVAVVAVASQSAAPVYYWVLPVLLGQPFLRIFLLAEHTGYPLVEDIRVNARATLTNRAMRWPAWNMPFHTFPEVHRRIRGGGAV